MTAKSLPHQDEKHVFDRGVVHARYGGFAPDSGIGHFQGLPIFLLYHDSAYNRLKPIPWQGPVPYHAQTGVFDVVWYKILNLSHISEPKTPHPDQTSGQDPSPRWREVAHSAGRWTDGRTDAKPTKPRHRPLRGSPPGPAIKDGLRPPAGARTIPTASGSRESSSHLVPACAELGPMLDALECGHEVAGADRGTLVLGGHQCGFGPDGAHFGAAPALGSLGDVGQRQLALA